MSKGTVTIHDARVLMNKGDVDKDAHYLPSDAQGNPGVAAERMVLVEVTGLDANGVEVISRTCPFWVYGADDAAVLAAIGDRIVKEATAIDLAKVGKQPVLGVPYGAPVPV